MTRRSAHDLSDRIDPIVADQPGERNMYPDLKAFFLDTRLQLGWPGSHWVFDASRDFSSGIPDVSLFPTARDGKPERSPLYVCVVGEVKLGELSDDAWRAILNDPVNGKQRYVRPHTRFFLLIDQVRVRLVDLQASPKLDTFTVATWDALRSTAVAVEFFSPLRRDLLDWDGLLDQFRAGLTPFAYVDVATENREDFVETIAQVSRRIQDAVLRVLQETLPTDLAALHAAVAAEIPQPDHCQVAAHRDGRRLYAAFPAIDAAIAKLPRLTPEDRRQRRVQADTLREQVDRAREAVGPWVYALDIEQNILPPYVAKLGYPASGIDLRQPTATAKNVLEAFAYETSSLILARVLLVRFSEDHGFLTRYVTNGGLAAFRGFATHFKAGYEVLLQQVYQHARSLYHSLFDVNALDWILERPHPAIQDVLERALFELSRFNMQSVKGDLLSGVYDRFLEPNRRKRLGEYYTPPGLARYMLQLAGYQPGQTVLDPACGTGTFLIEALRDQLDSLARQGTLTPDMAQRVLVGAAGLDLNVFAISLAQIQMFWHLFEMLRNATPDEVRAFARAVIPAIQLFGGLSSLENPSITLGRDQADDWLIDERGTDYDPRYLRLNHQQYDLVIANPPFIRSHRQPPSELLRRDYQPILGSGSGQLDLSFYFLFKALRHWARTGGRIAFVLPFSALEANYAEAMRRVILSESHVVAVLDLELVAPHLFDADVVPVVLVLERLNGRAPAPHDPLHIEQATGTVFDASHIERHTLTRAEALSTTYGVSPLRLLPKIRPGDSAILRQIAQSPRLRDRVKNIWIKKKVVSSVPIPGVRPRPLVGEGLKLGGQAHSPGGELPIFKGANVFPQALHGTPLGEWDGTPTHISSPNLYRYRSHFGPFTYVFRKIAQVPVACLVNPAVVATNDSTYLATFDVDPQLDVVCLARPLQFFALKVCRTGTLLRGRSDWYKNELLNLPIPDRRLPEDLRRAVLERLTATADHFQPFERILKDPVHPLLRDHLRQLRYTVDLTSASDDDAGPVGDLRLTETGIGGDLLYRVGVDDPQLRRWLWHALQVLHDADSPVTKDMILSIPIPTDLPAALAVLDDILKHDNDAELDQLLNDVDQWVADSYGLSAEQLEHIQTAFRTDPFLQRMAPNLLHRGFKDQAYRANYGRSGTRYQ